MIGWIVAGAAVLLPIAWVLGGWNVHRRDERGIANLRRECHALHQYAETAEEERDRARQYAQEWEATARRAQQEHLAEAGEQLKVLAKELREMTEDRNTLRLQLAEATAKRATHAQIPPARPRRATLRGGYNASGTGGEA